MVLNTRRKASGRFQAAANAAMAPELAPPMRAQIGVGGEVVGLADLGEDLVEQEPRVAVAHIVVLDAAVEARQRAFARRRHDAGVDEDADGDRHVAFVNQVVEDDRHAPVAAFADVALRRPGTPSRRRLRRVVLLRHVDPVVARRAGIDRAGPACTWSPRHAARRAGPANPGPACTAAPARWTARRATASAASRAGWRRRACACGRRRRTRTCSRSP